MKYSILLSLFLLFYLSSCTNRHYNAILDAAETVMQALPDSALYLLQSLDEQHILNGALQARYALLYTQALDKNYLLIHGDSLINIAVDYYSKKKDYKRLGWAYLYQGNAYAQMDSIKLAIITYNNAQGLLEKYPNDELLSLVTSEMGALYKKQRHFTEALRLYRASLAACRKSGNLKNENYVLGYIGDVFYVSRISVDSAEIYYNKAKELSILRKDTAYRYRLDLDICAVLRVKKEYQKAKEVLMEVIQEMRGHHIAPLDYYPLLSVLFLDLQQIDSARYYMHLVLNDTLASAKQRVGAFAALKTIEVRAGNTELALYYSTRYKALSDSIQRTYILHDVRVIEGKYHQQRLVSKIANQKIKYITLISSFIIISFACIIGIVNWWRKHTIHKEHHHTQIIAQKEKLLNDQARDSLLNNWNTALFKNEFKQGIVYREQETFYAKIIATANMVYPGLTNRLNKCFPQLNEADTVLICLLFSGYKPQDICVFYKIWNTVSIYARQSRIYHKLGVKIDRKSPRQIRDILIDFCVSGKM